MALYDEQRQEKEAKRSSLNTNYEAAREVTTRARAACSMQKRVNACAAATASPSPPNTRTQSSSLHDDPKARGKDGNMAAGGYEAIERFDAESTRESMPNHHTATLGLPRAESLSSLRPGVSTDACRCPWPKTSTIAVSLCHRRLLQSVAAPPIRPPLEQTTVVFLTEPFVVRVRPCPRIVFTRNAELGRHQLGWFVRR